jgi:hypothetical protein
MIHISFYVIYYGYFWYIYSDSALKALENAPYYYLVKEKKNRKILDKLFDRGAVGDTRRRVEQIK